MHQVKKGNEWHFGMKMHIGVDESLGLIHSIETTPANEHDLNVADKILHGKEERVGLMPGTQAHRIERTLSPIIVNGLLPCGPASARSFRQKTLKKQNTLRPVCAPRLSMRSSHSPLL